MTTEQGETVRRRGAAWWLAAGDGPGGDRNG